MSTRDPNCFGVPHDPEERRLEMALSQKRTLHTRTVAKPLRRVKAAMKQIVGDTFQGLSQPNLECEIIRALVFASETYKDDPRLPLPVRKEKLKKAVDTVEALLKRLLDQRVSYVISQISERLFDPKSKLTWSLTTNNCQNFCDTMLPWEKMGNFLGSPLSGATTSTEMSYMMSFVARPGSYRREKVISKFDVPNGLTEEYLLRFRQGRHDDSDLVDTLQEYWHDWGKLTIPRQSIPRDMPLTLFRCRRFRSYFVQVSGSIPMGLYSGIFPANRYLQHLFPFQSRLELPIRQLRSDKAPPGASEGSLSSGNNRRKDSDERTVDA